MSGVFGGGGSNANTTTNTSSPPPQTLADYQGLINRATAVANTPFTPYPGEQVAPLSNQMNAGLGNVDQYAYAAQPYLQQAGQMTQAAAAPVTPASYSGSAVGQFMNPFTSSVIDATQQQFNNQNAQQAQFLNSQNIGAGAFGGDRAGLSQSILAGQQQTAQAPVIAGLNQANYNQALAEFNNQQQTGLGAQEFNNQQKGQMAAQYGNLGTAAQTAGLQGASAQLQAGMIPQTEQQNIDNALQNTWTQGQQYPFQTTGFLGNLIEGIGSQTGGNASTTTPAPSLGSQLLGLGTAGAGIASNLFGSAAGGTSAASGIGSALSGLFGMFSDERLKENIEPIGKTFDGQTIHKYNFKGDPRTQIGLLAQEVERRHPHAVGQGLGGLKMVDYDAATRESERAGFQDGGVPTATGGNVSPGSVFDLGVGKGFSPSGAMALMDPNSGAGAGTGRFGAGNLSMTPAGTLFGRSTPQVASPAAGPSPMSPLQAGPYRQASAPFTPAQPGPMFRPTPGQVMQARSHGGRIGREIGGPTGLGGPIIMSGIPNTPFVDNATEVAIAQGTGVPNPFSGVSNIEFSNATGTNSGAGSQNGVQIGTSSLSPSQPNLSGAPAGTTFKPIDYQDPINDFQTAGAEKSLGPHYFTTGKNGELVYGGEGSSTAPGAVNKGPLLDRPGVETPQTENPPPPAPAPGPAAPAPAPAAAPAPAPAGPHYLGQVSGGAASTNAGLQGGQLIWSGGGFSSGGRAGFDNGGGLGGLDDPRYSFYTPQTGNARGAAYHPPIPTPAPQPAPRRIFAPAVPPPRPAVRQAPIRIPPAAKAAGPQPLTQPTPPHTPTPAPKPMVLPTLNPADTPIPRPPLLPGSYDDPSAPGAGIYHPMDPGRRGGLMGAFDNPLDALKDQLNQNLEDRPGFNLGGANAGVMGQWPLAGATGYTPQGHGVTGQDSQGAPMGSGSVAKKAAGFDGMFGSGFWHGGRTGFQDGGLSGLGMMPEVQLVPYDILKGIAPLQVSGKSTIPDPKVAEKAQQGGSSDPLKGLGDSLTKLSNGLSSQDSSGLDSLSASDLGDIASAGPDLGDLSLGMDLGFGLGGVVRPRRRFWDGGGEGVTSSVSTGDNSATNTTNMGGVSAVTGDATTGFGIGDMGVANTGGSGSPGGNNSNVSPRGGAPNSSGVSGANANNSAVNTFSSMVSSLLGQVAISQANAQTVNPSVMAALNSALSNLATAKGTTVSQLYANPQSVLGFLSPSQLATLKSGLAGKGTAGLQTFGNVGVPAGLGGGGTGVAGTGGGTDGPSAASNPSVAAQVNALVQAMYESQHPYGNAGFGGGSPTATQGTTGPAAPAPAAPSPGNPAVVANPRGTAPRGGLGGVAGTGGPPGVTSIAAPSAIASSGGGGSGRDPVVDPNPGGRLYRGGRTRGVVRPGFLDGGPPEPPVPVPPAPIVPPSPSPAAAPAAEAISAATTPKFDASGYPTNRAETTPAQREAFGRAYAKSIGLDPNRAAGVGRSEGYNAPGAGPSTVDIENGKPFSWGDYQLNTKAGVGVDALKAGIDPRDPNQWQEADKFALDTMKKGGLGPWKGDAYVKGLGGSGGGGGGGALAFSGGGAGGGQNQQQQQIHYQAAMEDASRPPDRKLLPPGIGDTLIMMGAGMMAGTSSHPLVNIGQGIQEGMKYYQQQRMLDREWEKNEAQIEDWHSQAKNRDAETALHVQNLDLTRFKMGPLAAWYAGGMQGPMPQYQPSGGTVVSSSPPTTAPVASPTPATAPTPATTAAKPIPTTPGAVINAPGGPKTAAGATPAVAAPATPPTPTTPPSEAPAAPSEFQTAMQALKKKFDMTSGMEIAGLAPAGTATTIRQQMIEAQKTGRIVTDDGRVIIDPSFQSQEAAGAAQTKYQEGLAEETSKTIAAIPAKMQSRQIVDQRLGEIQDMMKGYTPGAFAEEKADLAAKAASIFGRDFVPETWMKDAATFQRMVKDQIMNTMDGVKAMGGRPMVAEIESMKRAMAGPEMQPGAAAAIIAQTRGIIKWQDDHDNALSDWADQNPREFKTAKFEKQFIKDHPLKSYIEEARHNFPYQGQTIPPASQREEGQAYMTPKGPWVWHNGQWAPFQAAQ